MMVIFVSFLLPATLWTPSIFYCNSHQFTMDAHQFWYCTYLIILLLSTPLQSVSHRYFVDEIEHKEKWRRMLCNQTYKAWSSYTRFHRLMERRILLLSDWIQSAKCGTYHQGTFHDKTKNKVMGGIKIKGCNSGGLTCSYICRKGIGGMGNLFLRTEQGVCRSGKDLGVSWKGSMIGLAGQRSLFLCGCGGITMSLPLPLICAAAVSVAVSTVNFSCQRWTSSFKKALDLSRLTHTATIWRYVCLLSPKTIV